MKRLRGIRLHCFLCSHITTFQSARFRTLIRFTWRWIYQIDAYEQGKQKNWSIYMFIFTYTVSTYRFKLMYSDRLVAKNMGSTSQQSDVGEPQVRATSFTWTWTRSSFGPCCILLLPVYNILISLLVMYYVPYLITLLFSSLMEQYAVCLFIQFLLLQHVGLSRHLRFPPDTRNTNPFVMSIQHSKITNFTSIVTRVSSAFLMLLSLFSLIARAL